MTAELRALLKRSSSWKTAQIDSNRQLEVVRHGNKEYVGRYATSSPLDLRQVKQMEESIYSELLGYCPTLLEIEQLTFYLLAQLFVS